MLCLEYVSGYPEEPLGCSPSVHVSQRNRAYNATGQYYWCCLCWGVLHTEECLEENHCSWEHQSTEQYWRIWLLRKNGVFCLFVFPSLLQTWKVEGYVWVGCESACFHFGPVAKFSSLFSLSTYIVCKCSAMLYVDGLSFHTGFRGSRLLQQPDNFL